MDLIKNYTPFSRIYDCIRQQCFTYNICRGSTRGNIIYVQLIKDDQMLKQQSCIKENIHVLLLWRSHYQEGRVAFVIPLIVLTLPHFVHVLSRTCIFNERCERHVESVEKYSVSCAQMTKDGIGS
jgi:hypothetical protein